MNRVPKPILVAIPLLALLALGAGYRPSTPRIEVRPSAHLLALGSHIPPIDLAIAPLVELPKSNGSGQVTADVGGELVSVVQGIDTHLGKLAVMPGVGQYRLLATSPDGKTSIALVLLGHGDSWRLGAAMVRTGNRTYVTTTGTVKVHQTGVSHIEGTFSLVATQTGPVKQTITVQAGRFSVRLRQ